MDENIRDTKPNMFFGAYPFVFQKAQELRARETEAEKLLWSKLCKKQLGVKIRRQHPVYNYIADFYCHACKLVIEVDGPYHNTKEMQEYDKVRSQAFAEFKIEIIRFSNEEVMNKIEWVVEQIRSRVKKCSP
jgi:very-short-patch-repair endonuclease